MKPTSIFEKFMDLALGCEEMSVNEVRGFFFLRYSCAVWKEAVERGVNLQGQGGINGVNS